MSIDSCWWCYSCYMTFEKSSVNARMSECRRKASPVSAFLPVVSCLSPASLFWHQDSVQYRWSRIIPALPSYAETGWGHSYMLWVLHSQTDCLLHVRHGMISDHVGVPTCGLWKDLTPKIFAVSAPNSIYAGNSNCPPDRELGSLTKGLASQ